MFGFSFTESYYPKFRDSGVIQTLMKLIKTKEVNPQSCYNAMAVLESFSLKGSQDVILPYNATTFDAFSNASFSRNFWISFLGALMLLLVTPKNVENLV